MPGRDPAKAKAASKRYAEKKKVEKYGPSAAGVDMRGRHGNHASGPFNGRWNDGLTLNEDGYVKVSVGIGHPLADPNGWAYLHLLVWVAAGNERPIGGWLIHHKNEVKTDNRIENLVLMSRIKHAELHSIGRDRRGDGTYA